MRRKLSLTALAGLFVLTILAGTGKLGFADSKLKIHEVDKPTQRKERHQGAKYVWGDKWAKVRIRNKSKEWVPGIEVSLSVYDRDKELIETRTNFSVAWDDKKRYDGSNKSIEGRKTITVWFRFEEAFLRRNKPKYYEVKLLKDGEVMDRMTAPRSFLKELEEREKTK